MIFDFFLLSKEIRYLFFEQDLNGDFKAVRRDSIVENVGHKLKLELYDHREQQESSHQGRHIEQDKRIQGRQDPLLLNRILRGHQVPSESIVRVEQNSEAVDEYQQEYRKSKARNSLLEAKQEKDTLVHCEEVVLLVEDDHPNGCLHGKAQAAPKSPALENLG